MSFISGVTSTDDQDIDLMFGVKTPGADNLLENKKKDDPSKTTPAVTAVEGEPQPEVIDHDKDANLLLGDDAPASEGNEGVQEPVAPVKKPEPKKTASTVKVPEGQEIDFEAIYNDMVVQGIWKEVELPEGAKWDKEMFLQAQKLQTTAQYEDLLSRTGPYGKAIIEYEQNGGNPGELLNLFREQREVQQFGIEDAESQETFLRAYLESQGNSQKSIDRTIRALQDQGPDALKEEAEEKKTIWDEQYNDEIEARKKEQALYNKQLEEAQKNFESTIATALTGDAEATPKEKRDLQSYMLNFNQSYQGRNVSQFYVDMAEIQKDP